MAVPLPVETPSLPLQACSVADHCRALSEIRELPFWWYQGVSRIFGNYSLPFEDGSGNWWYQVKPGLCWPADFLRPIEAASVHLGISRSALGYQHVVCDKNSANSHLVINVIQEISTYGLASVDSKRRNSIRKGLKSCLISVARELDNETLEGCRAAWAELTRRTGWKQAVEPKRFARTLKALVNCAGVTILVGRDAAGGDVAGFLIVKTIGDTAYVDTIASRSELLRLNVNDALMYSFVCSAAKVPGVRKAHYAIKSMVEPLERFKSSIGFEPVPYPAKTILRPLVGPALRLVRPAAYRRLVGLFDGATS